MDVTEVVITSRSLWKKGLRPVIQGNTIQWYKEADVVREGDHGFPADRPLWRYFKKLQYCERYISGSVLKTELTSKLIGSPAEMKAKIDFLVELAHENRRAGVHPNEQEKITFAPELVREVQGIVRSLTKEKVL